MRGIIGSGFGFYGYLPALAQISSDSILIPEKYAEAFSKRVELDQFKNIIQWAKDETVLLESSELVVLSVSPKAQEELISIAQSYSTIQTLILEKPLGVSPENSKEILSKLLLSNKIFRINYSFIYTKWYKQLFDIIEKYEVLDIKINWNFLAHHYKNNLENCKRYHITGGAVIRFYGIHVIAMLAAFGYTNPLISETAGYSEEDIYLWNAQIKNSSGAIAEVLVNSNSTDEEFRIELTYKTKSENQETFTVKLKEPFAEALALDGLDPRIEIVKNVYTSLKEDNTEFYKIYNQTNELWQKIEHSNKSSEKSAIKL